MPDRLPSGRSLLPCLCGCQLHFLLSSECDFGLFLANELRLLSLLLVEGDFLVVRKCLKLLALVVDHEH
jgi:hypothetical protein